MTDEQAAALASNGKVWMQWLLVLLACSEWSRPDLVSNCDNIIMTMTS